jgi:hypothetical protein
MKLSAGHHTNGYLLPLPFLAPLEPEEGYLLPTSSASKECYHIACIITIMHGLDSFREEHKSRQDTRFSLPSKSSSSEGIHHHVLLALVGLQESSPVPFSITAGGESKNFDPSCRLF